MYADFFGAICVIFDIFYCNFMEWNYICPTI